MVTENPGEIHLLAIGPLTNLALAFSKAPEIARKLAHLTIMGGALRGPLDLHLPIAEHNIVCNPDAAQIVLSSGAPITMVPLDVTTKTLIRKADVEKIRAAGDPLRDAIADQVERYPRFAANGATALHDPLAAAVIVYPSLVEFIDVNVAVETQGRLTTAATVFRAPSATYPRNARLAITVDAPRAETFIVDRIGA
jgi:purine nucleosidase